MSHEDATEDAGLTGLNSILAAGALLHDDGGQTVHTPVPLSLCSRNEYILGIPIGSVSHGNPMGMGIAKLVSLEWKWNGNGLMEMVGNKNFTFSHFPPTSS